jgi:hypothetical protein
MPTYTATDGKQFHHTQQYRKYQDWLDQQEKAPTGNQHKQAILDHGNVRHIEIDVEGSGRHRVTMKHADGSISTSVHPQAFRALEVAKEHYVPPAPAAIETHARSRAHPVGPKETERQRREEGEERNDP